MENINLCWSEMVRCRAMKMENLQSSFMVGEKGEIKSEHMILLLVYYFFFLKKEAFEWKV